MRISIPTIPDSVLSSVLSTPVILPEEAAQQIASFLSSGNVALLTGAGVSVDSGIRAYRGKDGRYMNPNYKPILYHQLVDESAKGYAFRQRYWLRSFLGYPPVRDAIPNTSHYAIAALQYTGHISRLITQNVDGLHTKAIKSLWTPGKIEKRILELHGTLHKVSCKHGHVVDRNVFQEWLANSNPRWSEFADELERTGQKLRTNPDGDVAIEGATHEDFVVPDCPECLKEGNTFINMHKPHLIFFGESISQEVKERSYQDIEIADRLFVVGTTLATYSAFRLLKHALELGKPVLMLNVGPTRADMITSAQQTAGVDFRKIEKIELPSGLVLRDVVRNLMRNGVESDPVLSNLLKSGVNKPPGEGDDDRAPRAAG